ncbi:hypothetical protein HELRODRAFT_173995 [Helobdella robusta]|uniref:Uncharacterized protein n=1 Tax=Helobdella robusta TaxID=6412 RepID=T1F7G6_HELRO|nr:hypothetical protein HELRODRAFT_173995 [Helobdella robusta]ESO03110.1 hypothetical protein HELRODRAFT_173995 [Helobdella robusta]
MAKYGNAAKFCNSMFGKQEKRRRRSSTKFNMGGTIAEELDDDLEQLRKFLDKENKRCVVSETAFFCITQLEHFHDNKADTQSFLVFVLIGKTIKSGKFKKSGQLATHLRSNLLAENLLMTFQKLAANMSVKLHSLHSHSHDFPSNLGAMGEEGRFHQDIKTMSVDSKTDGT